MMKSVKISERKRCIKSIFWFIVLCMPVTCISDPDNKNCYGIWQGMFKYPALELIGSRISEPAQNPISSHCTVFYASDGMTMLGGNNEDWSDPDTKFWIIPSTDGKYGWIKFGFASGFPQGGMNEHGLFWDATGCTYLEMPYSEANKNKFSGPLMKKVMEECASVKEACVVFENYYCDDQYKAQYLIGDTTGVSMIVEGDSIILKSGHFQVATNFYHSHPELGGYPCWRYDTAVSMLENSDQISPYLFGSILSATHQEGSYPTQYSNIYDLKENIIYLFHFHNFEEFIKINLKDELKKGNRSYELPGLFSKIQVISPEESEELNTSGVVFKWKGEKTSEYDLCYSMNPDFEECTIVPAIASHLSDKNKVLFAAFIIFVATVSIIGRKSKKRVSFMLAIIIISFILINCSDEITTPSEETIREFSVSVEDLEKNSTYYWKVLAHSEDNKDFSSESVVHTFSTSN